MNKSMTFEKAMQKLEQIVQELEKGDLALEESFKKFEEGVKLSRFCSSKLDETEKKVSLLLKNDQGDLIETPFDENGKG
ncbi:MAG: exodeoxyribonuclease VII small subunit [Desulfobacterales bacterium]